MKTINYSCIKLGTKPQLIHLTLTHSTGWYKVLQAAQLSNTAPGEGFMPTFHSSVGDITKSIIYIIYI